MWWCSRIGLPSLLCCWVKWYGLSEVRNWWSWCPATGNYEMAQSSNIDNLYPFLYWQNTTKYPQQASNSSSVAKSQNWKNCYSVNLSPNSIDDNNIGDEGMQVLTAANLPYLKSLSVGILLMIQGVMVSVLWGWLSYLTPNWIVYASFFYVVFL